MSKTYRPFGNSEEEYSLAAPTNDRVKKLMKSELRAGMGSVSEKVQTARAFGWDPVEVIPNYTDSDGGESDVEPIGLPQHMVDVVKICLDGPNLQDREGEVRMDVAGEAKADFMNIVGAMSSGSSR